MTTQGQQVEGQNQNEPLTEAQIKAARAEIMAEEFGEEAGAKPAEPDDDGSPAGEADDQTGAEDVLDKKVEDKGAETKKPDDKGQDDPYAGMTPAGRKLFEGLDYRLKQAESRVGSLTNQLSEANKRAKTAEEDAAKSKKPAADEKAPTQEEIAAAAEDEQALKELKEEYPVWFKAFGAMLKPEKISEQLGLKAMQDRLDKLEKQGGSAEIVTSLQKELDGMKFQIVAARFPDFETITKSKDYVDWANDQPDEIRALHFSDNPADAIKMLDLFSNRETDNANDNGGKSTTAAKKDRLKAAETPNHGRRTQPAKSEDDMTDEEVRQKIMSEVFNEP